LTEERGGMGAALAEGLFWYAEKLHYGYEGVEKNFEEALRLYGQAAELGYPRAFLRIGEIEGLRNSCGPLPGSRILCQGPRGRRDHRSCRDSPDWLVEVSNATNRKPCGPNSFLRFRAMLTMISGWMSPRVRSTAIFSGTSRDGCRAGQAVNPGHHQLITPPQASSDRPLRVVPVTFSERMISQPAAFNRSSCALRSWSVVRPSHSPLWPCARFLSHQVSLTRAQ
jgi:hypothetical protein